MVTLTRELAIADFRERYKRLHTSTLQRPFQYTSQVPLFRSPIYPLVVSDCKALMTPPDHKKTNNSHCRPHTEKNRTIIITSDVSPWPWPWSLVVLKDKTLS